MDILTFEDLIVQMLIILCPIVLGIKFQKQSEYSSKKNSKQFQFVK